MRVKTIKVKVSELSGAALDWAVLVSSNTEEWFTDVFGGSIGCSMIDMVIKNAVSPSRNWAYGGPLIDKFKPHFTHHLNKVTCHTKLAIATADNYLIALCRAVVYGNLGDQVDIPLDLMEEKQC